MSKNMSEIMKDRKKTEELYSKLFDKEHNA